MIGITYPLLFFQQRARSDGISSQGQQQGTVPERGEHQMKNFTRIATALLQDESGQGLIEYALIAGLIGLVAVVAMTSVGTQIKTAFNSISSQLASAV
jgi:pilus assembly protein Flp/PilA